MTRRRVVVMAVAIVDLAAVVARSAGPTIAAVLPVAMVLDGS